MGEHESRRPADPEELRAFTKRVLADLRALESMLDEGRFETGVRRIGAEQELFLVDRRGRPATRAMEVLEEVADDHFTTELASFNLEFNLDPLELGPDCLSRMEADAEGLLAKVRDAARRHDVEVLLTGILPTLAKKDLSLDSMAPVPRYHALNEAMNRVRGQNYSIRIKGRDELIVHHDNVLLESCNTSFQVHFQVSPGEFVKRYNIAQAVAAPVLAVATNSPLLFGRQLWRETRIALFQQSIDIRRPTDDRRDSTARVSFGRDWVRSSVLEIFREDVARFRVLLANDKREDPFESLAGGGCPGLYALRLHNSTVYRWNRPCYGISDGKPHLRIENRVLPAGPTVVDQIANAAFWFGLMSALASEVDDISRVLDFDVAKENFLAAARLGLGAQFGWLEGETLPAQELVVNRLLELARRGLDEMGIQATDIDRYLGIIEERATTGRTGSQWLVDSLRGMREVGSPSERLAALTLGSVERQSGECVQPVARWTPATLDEAGRWKDHYATVGQLMTTDLFTVHKDELVDLVAYMMDWRHIRHVPVEDDRHRLVGLVTHRSILRVVASNLARDRDHPIPVSDVMQRDVFTVRPATSTLDAMRQMRERRISCLPVTNEDGVLVGIVTERDLMGIAGQLLEEFLADT